MDNQLLASPTMNVTTINNIPASDMIVDLHNAPTQHANNTKNKKLFPQKLWDLINDDKYNFCLRWSDDGQLVYLNRDDFEDSYLKTAENQFHTQKAISFVRQMNMYGFRKVDDCYYENDNFKRDCEHLLKNMIRKHPNKNPTSNNSSNNEMSPFLYRNNTTTNSTLQSPTASLLAPTPMNANFVDCRQRISYPLFSRSQFINGTENKNSVVTQDINHQYILDEDRFNEDSLSSSGDYCCSAGSSQGETLANVLDRIESTTNSDIHDHNNSLEILKTHNNQHQQLQQQQQQAQHLNLFPQLGSSIYDPFHFAQTTKDNSPPIGEGSGTTQLLGHIHDNNQFMKNLLPLNSYNMNLRVTTNNNTYDSLSTQQQNIQSTYIDQKELIKALVSQQSNNTQFARDLTTTPAKSHSSVQPENSNLNAFYALLSSINNNLYQPSAHMQNNQQSPTFDNNKFSSLQQIYQYMLAQQNRSMGTIHQNFKSNASSSNPTKRAEELSPNSSSLGKDTPPTSLLVRNKSLENTNKSSRSLEMFENGYRNSCQLGERFHDKHNSPVKTIQDSEYIAKRRDNKSNRSFKRSADSILDSNNNNSSPERTPDSSKRIKFETSPEERSDEHLSIINKNAKNLVIQVALAREARIDANVISEASRYTERFVETLFDTAQVIARHSNGSDPVLINDNPPPSEDKDTKNDKEVERSNINLSDLTSALKLLPSKLLKILK